MDAMLGYRPIRGEQIAAVLGAACAAEVVGQALCPIGGDEDTAQVQLFEFGSDGLWVKLPPGKKQRKLPSDCCGLRFEIDGSSY